MRRSERADVGAAVSTTPTGRSLAALSDEEWLARQEVDAPTAKLRRKMAKHVARGHSLENAARLLGYAPELFRAWYDEGRAAPGRKPSVRLRRWREAVQRAEAEAVEELLEDLAHAGQPTDKPVRAVEWPALVALLAALDPRFDRRLNNARAFEDSARYVVERALPAIPPDHVDRFLELAERLIGEIAQELGA